MLKVTLWLYTAQVAISLVDEECVFNDENENGRFPGVCGRGWFLSALYSFHTIANTTPVILEEDKPRYLLF